MSQVKAATGRELAGALGCGACQWAENEPAPEGLLWWNWYHWWNQGSYSTKGLAAALAIRADVRFALTFCVKSGAQQDCM